MATSVELKTRKTLDNAHVLLVAHSSLNTNFKYRACIFSLIDKTQSIKKKRFFKFRSLIKDNTSRCRKCLSAPVLEVAIVKLIYNQEPPCFAHICLSYLGGFKIVILKWFYYHQLKYGLFNLRRILSFRARLVTPFLLSPEFQEKVYLLKIAESLMIINQTLQWTTVNLWAGSS